MRKLSREGLGSIARVLGVSRSVVTKIPTRVPLCSGQMFDVCEQEKDGAARLADLAQESMQQP